MKTIKTKTTKMMRWKIAAVFAAMLFTFAAADRADAFSIGLGGLFANDFGRGASVDIPNAIYSIGGTYRGGTLWTMTAKQEQTDSYSFGAFAFFDARYVEVSVGYISTDISLRNSVEWKRTPGVLIGGIRLPPKISETNSIHADNYYFGVAGKIPFALNRRFTLFPLFGFDLRISLAAKDKDGITWENSAGKDDPQAWSGVWLFGGLGGDYYVTPSLFVRAELAYGIRVPYDAESDLTKSAKQLNKEINHELDADFIAGFPDYSDPTHLGHGFLIKLALGYRFF